MCAVRQPIMCSIVQCNSVCCLTTVIVELSFNISVTACVCQGTAGNSFEWAAMPAFPAEKGACIPKRSQQGIKTMRFPHGSCTALGAIPCVFSHQLVFIAGDCGNVLQPPTCELSLNVHCVNPYLNIQGSISISRRLECFLYEFGVHPDQFPCLASAMNEAGE